MAKNGPKNAKKAESAVGICRLPNPVTRFLTPFGRYHWGVFAEIHSGPKNHNPKRPTPMANPKRDSWCHLGPKIKSPKPVIFPLNNQLKPDKRKNVEFVQKIRPTTGSHRKNRFSDAYTSTPRVTRAEILRKLPLKWTPRSFRTTFKIGGVGINHLKNGFSTNFSECTTKYILSSSQC